MGFGRFGCFRILRVLTIITELVDSAIRPQRPDLIRIDTRRDTRQIQFFTFKLLLKLFICKIWIPIKYSLKNVRYTIYMLSACIILIKSII